MVYAKFCVSKIWRSPSVVRQHARAHTLLLAVAWQVGGGVALKILLEELAMAMAKDKKKVGISNIEIIIVLNLYRIVWLFCRGALYHMNRKQL